jgi:hypothetical protein
VYHHYYLLPNSCEARTVDGRSSAQHSIADFTSYPSRSMAEYRTFVRSNSMLALFFGSVPVDELDSYRKRLDPVIETLRIP